MSLNPEYEYNQCLARAENHKSFLNRDSHKTVCKYYWNKMLTCKTECAGDENGRQESLMHKCLPTSTTDKQLQECLKQNLMDSTLNVCKLKCELSANQIFRGIG